jgi:hypothetical protein
MMNLRDRLTEIAGPAVAPTAAEVDADLARGRRALRRRRAGRTAAGSTFGVAALVAAVSLATAGVDSAPQDPVADHPPAATATELVAYKGAQPKGYTIDKVPDGWEIQGVNEYALTLAPVGADDQIPDSFVGKIAIMLQSKDQHRVPAGKAVRVGHKGVLVKSEPGTNPPAGDTGWTLWIEQPTGAYLLIQFWEGLGFSEDAMVELGAGVQIHADAKQGAG